MLQLFNGWTDSLRFFRFLSLPHFVPFVCIVARFPASIRHSVCIQFFSLKDLANDRPTERTFGAFNYFPCESFHFGGKVLSFAGKIELFLFILGEMQSVLIRRALALQSIYKFLANALSRHNVSEILWSLRTLKLCSNYFGIRDERCDERVHKKTTAKYKSIIDGF